VNCDPNSFLRSHENNISDSPHIQTVKNSEIEFFDWFKREWTAKCFRNIICTHIIYIKVIHFSETKQINKAAIKLFRRVAGRIKGQFKRNDHIDRMQSAANSTDHCLRRRR